MWGPKCGAGEIRETLLMTCSFMFASCVAINELGEPPVFGDELSAHWEVYKGLSDQFGSDQAGALAAKP